MIALYFIIITNWILLTSYYMDNNKWGCLFSLVSIYNMIFTFCHIAYDLLDYVFIMHIWRLLKYRNVNIYNLYYMYDIIIVLKAYTVTIQQISILVWTSRVCRTEKHSCTQNLGQWNLNGGQSCSRGSKNLTCTHALHC